MKSEADISRVAYLRSRYHLSLIHIYSIKTLLLTLWKSEDDKVTKPESGELGSAVSAYIERIQSDRSIVPSFNTFYEYMRDDYRKDRKSTRLNSSHRL